MAWQPSNDGLSKIVSLLRESGSVVPGVQQNIHNQLQQFNSHPEYCNYLLYIFAKLTTEQEFTRTVAGLLLKNNIKSYWIKLSKETQNYIKTDILFCIGDPSAGIRRTLSSIITTIVMQERIEAWPTLIQSLTQYLDSTDLAQVDGSLGTIYILCEDSGGRLDSEEAGRPLNALIPKLISFFSSTHENFRRYALASLNHFITDMPLALVVNMQSFLSGIFLLSSDTSPEVRRKVCQALVTLLEVRQDYLMPHISNVIKYMLHSTNDPDENVALEACEFWSALAELPVCKAVLAEFLPQLVPVLLRCMQYSETDRVILGGTEEEDSMQPDQPENIRPRFHNSKVIGADDGYDDDEDGDDDDGGDEEATEWNLRKCSAAGLDILSSVFGDEILPILLPSVQEKIADTKPWWERESGILAIGAIAEGCLNGLVSHLPVVIPYFIGLLNDPKPLLRSITCWTLSRYSKWIVTQPSDKYLQPMMANLLTRVLDTNKKVQEAACSAFATLEEEAQYELVPFLTPILQTLVSAFSTYQAKNLLILYDAIATLADSVGTELNKPELVGILMPPLINRWNALLDSDRNLFPLLECLTSISTALGAGFQPFAQPVFTRCVKLIEMTVVQLAAFRSAPAEQQEAMEAPDKEFIVCALDLISGLAEGLGTGVESLVHGSNLLPLLGECMKDRGADVRQSSFALVGDLAKHCVMQLKPYLPEFIPLLCGSLYPDYISVCNNASWALGEIAVKLGPEMHQFVPPAVKQLIQIMTKPNLNRNLLENTAITLGRLGLVAPDLVAPNLEEFVVPWCLSLRNIRDDVEKDSAFRGMCMMIKTNPNGVVKSLVYVCDAIASWYYPADDLKEMFYQILHMYKNGMGDAWEPFYKNFPEPLRTSLQDRYKL